jgi:cytochrome c oxidase subunit IV
MSQDHSFDANKIFVVLFILTAVEVAWGAFIPYDVKWALWGGLMIMAFMKGYLIFAYFMHMKFEGWIVKGLIAPTIPLIFIVFFALMPDVGSNHKLIHQLADQLDPADGQVVEIGHGSRAIESHATEEEGGGGH